MTDTANNFWEDVACFVRRRQLSELQRIIFRKAYTAQWLQQQKSRSKEMRPCDNLTSRSSWDPYASREAHLLGLGYPFALVLPVLVKGALRSRLSFKRQK